MSSAAAAAFQRQRRAWKARSSAVEGGGQGAVGAAGHGKASQEDGRGGQGPARASDDVVLPQGDLELAHLEETVAGLRDEVQLQRKLVHLTTATYERELRRISEEAATVRQEAERKRKAEVDGLQRRIEELEAAVGTAASPSMAPSSAGASGSAAAGLKQGLPSRPSAKSSGAAHATLQAVSSARQQLLLAAERARQEIDRLERGLVPTDASIESLAGELDQLQIEASRQWDSLVQTEYGELLQSASAQGSAGALASASGVQAGGGGAAVAAGAGGAGPSRLQAAGLPDRGLRVKVGNPAAAQQGWRKVPVPRAVQQQREIMQCQWTARVGDLQRRLAEKDRVLEALGGVLKQRVAALWQEVSRKDQVIAHLAELAKEKALQEELAEVGPTQDAEGQDQEMAPVDMSARRRRVEARRQRNAERAKVEELVEKLKRMAAESARNAERAMEIALAHGQSLQQMIGSAVQAAGPSTLLPPGTGPACAIACAGPGPALVSAPAPVPAPLVASTPQLALEELHAPVREAAPVSVAEAAPPPVAGAASAPLAEAAPAPVAEADSAHPVPAAMIEAESLAGPPTPDQDLQAEIVNLQELDSTALESTPSVVAVPEEKAALAMQLRPVKTKREPEIVPVSATASDTFTSALSNQPSYPATPSEGSPRSQMSMPAAGPTDSFSHWWGSIAQGAVGSSKEAPTKSIASVQGDGHDGRGRLQRVVTESAASRGSRGSRASSGKGSPTSSYSSSRSSSITSSRRTGPMASKKYY